MLAMLADALRHANLQPIATLGQGSLNLDTNKTTTRKWGGNGKNEKPT